MFSKPHKFSPITILSLLCFIVQFYAQEEDIFKIISSTFPSRFLHRYLITLILPASSSLLDYYSASHLKQHRLAFSYIQINTMNRTNLTVGTTFTRARALPQLTYVKANHIEELLLILIDIEDQILRGDPYYLQNKQNILLLDIPANVSVNYLKILMLEVPTLFQQDALTFTIRRAEGNPQRPLWIELYHIKKQILVVETVPENDELLGIFRRRSNMRHVILNAIFQFELEFEVPFLNLDKDGNPMQGIGTGYNFLQTLLTSLNFIAVIVNGTGWIRPTPDGGIDGIGAQLLAGDGDFTLDALHELVPYRAEKLAFSQPLIVIKCEIFFKRVGLAAVKNIFYEAFQPRLWLALAATWCALCISWLFSLALLWSCSGDTLTEHDSEIPYNLIISSVSFICQQGWHSHPSKTSLRVIFLSANLLAFIAYAFYSAYILCIFAADPNMFHSIQDFPKYGYTLATHSHSATAIVFLEDCTRKYSTKVKIYDDVNELIHSILTTPTTLIMSPDDFFSASKTSSNYSQQVRCSLRSSTVKINSITANQGVYFRKNNPLKSFFAHKFSLMAERGLTHRMRLEHDRATIPVCIDLIQNTPALQLHELRSSFYIFTTGALISLFIFGFEILVLRTGLARYVSKPKFHSSALYRTTQQSTLTRPPKINVRSYKTRHH